MTSFPVSPVWADPSESPAAAATQMSTLPDHLGRVVERWSPTENRTGSIFPKIEPVLFSPLVIHIQDLHAHPQTQHTIAQILQHLYHHYGAQTIAVEGASGGVPTEDYARFPYVDIRDTVAQFFVEQALLSGAEYAAIAHPETVRLVGVEDNDVYQAHVRAYLEAHDARAVLTDTVTRAQAQLKRRARRVYPRALRRLNATHAAYTAGTLDLRAYVTQLVRLADAHGLALEAYPALQHLQAWYAHEASLKLDRVAHEHQALLHQLMPQLTPADRARVVRRQEEVAAGRYASAAYYRQLKPLAGAYGIVLDPPTPDRRPFWLTGWLRGWQRVATSEAQLTGTRTPYPYLARYVALLTLNDALDTRAVHHELEGLYARVAHVLAHTDAARAVWQQQRHLDLLAQLAAAQLSPEEWSNYQAHRETLRSQLPTLYAELAQHDVDLTSLEQFYTLAIERDHILAENTVTLLEIGKNGTGSPHSHAQNRELVPFSPHTVVLITGGFHTPGITEYFRSQHIPYIVIAPRVDAPVSHDLYEQRLRGMLPSIPALLRAFARYAPTQTSAAVHATLSPRSLVASPVVRFAFLAVATAAVLAMGVDPVDAATALQAAGFPEAAVTQATETAVSIEPHVLTAGVVGVDLFGIIATLLVLATGALGMAIGWQMRHSMLSHTSEQPSVQPSLRRRVVAGLIVPIVGAALAVPAYLYLARSPLPTRDDAHVATPAATATTDAVAVDVARAPIASREIAVSETVVPQGGPVMHEPLYQNHDVAVRSPIATPATTRTSTSTPTPTPLPRAADHGEGADSASPSPTPTPLLRLGDDPRVVTIEQLEDFLAALHEEVNNSPAWSMDQSGMLPRHLHYILNKWSNKLSTYKHRKLQWKPAITGPPEAVDNIRLLLQRLHAEFLNYAYDDRPQFQRLAWHFLAHLGDAQFLDEQFAQYHPSLPAPQRHDIADRLFRCARQYRTTSGSAFRAWDTWDPLADWTQDASDFGADLQDRLARGEFEGEHEAVAWVALGILHWTDMRFTPDMFAQLQRVAHDPSLPEWFADWAHYAVRYQETHQHPPQAPSQQSANSPFHLFRDRKDDEGELEEPLPKLPAPRGVHATRSSTSAQVLQAIVPAIAFAAVVGIGVDVAEGATSWFQAGGDILGRVPEWTIPTLIGMAGYAIGMYQLGKRRGWRTDAVDATSIAVATPAPHAAATSTERPRGSGDLIEPPPATPTPTPAATLTLSHDLLEVTEEQLGAFLAALRAERTQTPGISIYGGLAKILISTMRDGWADQLTLYTARGYTPRLTGPPWAVEHVRSLMRLLHEELLTYARSSSDIHAPSRQFGLTFLAHMGSAQLLDELFAQYQVAGDSTEREAIALMLITCIGDYTIKPGGQLRGWDIRGDWAQDATPFVRMLKQRLAAHSWLDPSDASLAWILLGQFNWEHIRFTPEMLSELNRARQDPGLSHTVRGWGTRVYEFHRGTQNWNWRNLPTPKPTPAKSSHPPFHLLHDRKDKDWRDALPPPRAPKPVGDDAPRPQTAIPEQNA